MVKLVNTGLRDIRFSDCKMLGLHFEDCSDFLFAVHFDKCILNLSSFFKQKLKKTIFKDCSDFLFAVHFEKCILNLSSFFKQKLKKTIFKECSLHEVDFTEADCSQANFDNCDLTGAKFEKTNLEKADMSTSFNYSIDPELNRIKKAKFSMDGIAGLLDKYDIEIH
jgi:uncharacterized protein YjbI with pentapeptide repeats